MLYKRLVPPALAVVLLSALSLTVVQAEVTGSFDIDVGLIPTGTQIEATPFFVDLQSTLQLNVTLSGLTWGLNAGFGPTGIEFAILRLSTSLGALAVRDTAVFATPFFNTSATDPVTPDEIHPTSTSGSKDNNGPSFAKNRVALRLNVAGLALSNLLIFEDVDFPNPLKYINPTYNPDGVDATVDTGGRGLANQTPSLGLGDVMSVEGQTLSGVTIRSSTGLCVRPEHNVIGKRLWPKSVDPDCGTSSPLLLGFERVRVEGVSLGGATLNGEFFWSPSLASVKSALSFSLLSGTDVVLTLSSNDLTHLNLDVVRVDATSSALSFSALDLNGDLNFDLIQATLAMTLNPKRSPASLKLRGFMMAGTGLVFGKVVLSVKKDLFTYALTTVFDTAAGGTSASWNHTHFDLSAKVGTFNVELKSVVSASGLRRASVKLGVAF